jgi:hypothetical protein
VNLHPRRGPQHVHVAYMADGVVTFDEIHAPDGEVNAKILHADHWWSRKCRGYVKVTGQTTLYADVKRIRIEAVSPRKDPQ